jgi:ABC-2 type transport system ATP-binding protein
MRKDADSGRTIIFATHYLEEAEQFAQRTILVNKGKVIADGPTDHIRAIAAGRTVSSTIGKNPEQTLAAVQSLPDTKSATLTHDRLTVTTTNSDALALELLTNHGATDLEISKPSLENAFVDLTNAASNTATTAASKSNTEQEAAR